jgi:hypothetical protein
MPPSVYSSYWYRRSLKNRTLPTRRRTGSSLIRSHTVHILCILGTRKSVHTMHSMCTVWTKQGCLGCTNGCIFRLPVESRSRTETVSEGGHADPSLGAFECVN